MNQELKILNSYKHISLNDMNEVKLLNRVDTKFVFKMDKLNELFKVLKEDYDVLEIKKKVTISYESLYFDTKKLDAYYQHQRGKSGRYKIRFRNYVSSNLCFLEVKKKIKGRTVKERIKVNSFESELSVENLKFISKSLGVEINNLESSIKIFYDRITIVSKDRTERITFDLNLKYQKGEDEKVLDNIVIAELKQKKLARASKFYKTVKKLRVRNINISKYCTGIILTHKNIKYNSFKEKLLYINKLTNGYINRNIAA